jgi:phosphoribosylglycinamide formyltransferase-1
MCVICIGFFIVLSKSFLKFMMNLAFLVSGNGSTMQAIVEACQQGVIKAKPALVVTNNPQALAITRAAQVQVPIFILPPKALGANYYGFINALCKSYAIDLIVLAGYLLRVKAPLLTDFSKKIINIHPALLPKFGGQGMYGQQVHTAVLAASEKETGATVHWVDEQYDHGEIIAQARIPIEKNDTPLSLAMRLLPVEHQLLISVLQKISLSYYKNN